jgi:hypothetical protein
MRSIESERASLPECKFAPEKSFRPSGERAVPIREDLLDEIRTVVGQAASIGYADPSATNDVYESYVWALCLKAATRHGANVSYQTVHGDSATRLIFRTSPGNIYSTAQAYTHATIDFPGAPALEAHIGVKVTGKSRVLHECDVAIITADEGHLCRDEEVHPRPSKVLLAVECKFYTSAIKLELGRGFLGLTTDILRKDRYFVTNGHSTNVNKLIVYHQGEWEFGVVPSSREADDLLHSFARTFRNYRAQYQ